MSGTLKDRKFRDMSCLGFLICVKVYKIERKQNQVVRGSRFTTESEAEEKFTSPSLTDS